MAKGFSTVRQAAEDIQARRESGGGSYYNWFKLNDGESAIVRFLEQGEEVQWAWFHDVPVPGKNYGKPVVCRDQDDEGNRTGEPCPGCEENLPRKMQGMINLIHRDAPVLARDEKNRLIRDNNKQVQYTGKLEDQLKVWQSGITVFEELDGKDVTYKGLRSRDFKITRRGQQLQTRYYIEPADPDGGPKALSAADKKLAEEKPDLTLAVTPPLYEEWGKSGPKKDAAAEAPAVDLGPFARGRQ